MSLAGLSERLSSDADVIKVLTEKEADEKLDKEQREILKLMTANREQVQYKVALAQTIAEIKNGGPLKKEGTNNAN